MLGSKGQWTLPRTEQYLWRLWERNIKRESARALSLGSPIAQSVLPPDWPGAPYHVRARAKPAESGRGTEKRKERPNRMI